VYSELCDIQARFHTEGSHINDWDWESEQLVVSLSSSNTELDCDESSNEDSPVEFSTSNNEAILIDNTIPEAVQVTFMKP